MKLATAFLFTSTVATARAFTVGRSFSGIPLVLSASVQRSQSAHCSVGTKNSIRMMSSPAEFAKTEIASSDVRKVDQHVFSDRPNLCSEIYVILLSNCISPHV